MNRRLIIALAACAVLAACGKKAEDTKATAAGGEILPGTISDAMIDTDRSQAQAPLLAPPAGAPGGSTAMAGSDATHAADDATAVGSVSPDGTTPVAAPSDKATDSPRTDVANKPAAKAIVVPKPAASAKPKPDTKPKPRPSASGPAG